MRAVEALNIHGKDIDFESKHCLQFMLEEKILKLKQIESLFLIDEVIDQLNTC